MIPPWLCLLLGGHHWTHGPAERVCDRCELREKEDCGCGSKKGH